MPSPSGQPHPEPLRLPRRRSTKKSVLWAVAISIGLHLPLLGVLPGAFDDSSTLEPTEFDADQEFSLTVVDDQQEQREEQDEEELEERDGQFVSLEAPEEEQRPDEARFLDQYDSQADQETARREPSKNQGPGASDADSESPGPQPTHRPDRAGEPEPPQPAQPEPPEPDPAEEPDPTEQEPQDAAEQPVDESEAEPAESADDAVDLAEAEVADEGVVQESADEPGAVEPPAGQQRRPDPSELFPSMKDARASMKGGNVDYLRDVDEGDKTLLNRKQSRYWSFMNRLKEQVVQQWSPAEEYRRRDPNGKVYGIKDRFANLRITLNGDGSLRTIYVAEPSGLDFYDAEAVRAVRDAAPFPNPPEGMKDQDGLIHITFGFLLDLHTGSMRDIRIRRR